MTERGADVIPADASGSRSTPTLAAVRQVAARIGERSAEIAAGRHLPADLVEDLRGTGILGMALPRELGGEEAEPVDVLLAVEALSIADGSVGWCAGIATGSTALAAYIPEAGARQVFARPDVFAGGSLNVRDARARPVEGGFRVSGRWGFGSGSQHNAWMCGGCVVVDEEGQPQLAETGAPVARLVFFPRADMTIHDTWHVSGMEGTGSNDYSVDGIFVPTERTMAFEFVPWPAGWVWRVPPLSLTFSPLAAVPLGIGRAAIDELVELAGVKTPYRSGRRLADRDVVQATVAQAEAALRSARHFLLDSMAEVCDVVRRGEEPTMLHRAMVRLACVNASRAAVEAAGRCYEAGGTTSIFTGSRLNRLWRDVNVASQHVALSYTGWETVGRVLLGLEPDTALI